MFVVRCLLALPTEIKQSNEQSPAPDFIFSGPILAWG